MSHGAWLVAQEAKKNHADQHRTRACARWPSETGIGLGFEGPSGNIPPASFWPQPLRCTRQPFTPRRRSQNTWRVQVCDIQV